MRMVTLYNRSTLQSPKTKRMSKAPWGVKKKGWAMLTYSNQERVLCCIQGTGKEEGIVATPDQQPSVLLGMSKKAAWGSLVDGP